MNKEGKWGFLDEHLELKIRYLYDDPWAFKNGKARVVLDGDVIWIDKAGNRIEPAGEPQKD